MTTKVEKLIDRFDEYGIVIDEDQANLVLDTADAFSAIGIGGDFIGGIICMVLRSRFNKICSELDQTGDGYN